MSDIQRGSLSLLERLNTKPGSMVRVTNGRHLGEWVKLDPKVLVDPRELEACWARLGTGEVRHYSWLADPLFPLELVREGPV
jgi:hypothetical protein